MEWQASEIRLRFKFMLKLSIAGREYSLTPMPIYIQIEPQDLWPSALCHWNRNRNSIRLHACVSPTPGHQTPQHYSHSRGVSGTQHCLFVVEVEVHTNTSGNKPLGEQQLGFSEMQSPAKCTHTHAASETQPAAARKRVHMRLHPKCRIDNKPISSY